MKKINFSIFLIISTFAVAFSQVPASFNYQAVVRNSSGEILANKTVSFQISLLRDSESGTVVYSETHSLSTNDFGLVNLKIGKGTKLSGAFSPADWGEVIFTKIEIDPAGGSSFSHLATTKLSSVPYAFKAQTVVDDAVDDADADPANELQILTLTGTLLELSDGGGSVTLPTSGSGGGDNWGAQVVKTDATLTGDGKSTNPLGVVADGDGDATNELQTISRSGNLIELSDGGGTITDEVDDADADPANELQALTLTGTLLELSDGGGSVTLPTSGGGGGDNWGAQTVKTDATLTGNGTSTSLLKVNGDLTDDQTLSLSGNDLSISGGNTVTLPASESSLWNESGSSVYRNSGNVGIGTVTPEGKLHVANGNIVLDDGNLVLRNSENEAFAIQTDNQATKFFNVSGKNMEFYTSEWSGGTNLWKRLEINSDGETRVFGTLYAKNTGTGGAAKFEGKIQIRDGTQGYGKYLTSDKFGNASWQTREVLWTESGDNITRSSGNVIISNSLNVGEIKLSEGAGAGKVLTSDASGVGSWESSLWVESGKNVYQTTGYVGIGTSSPKAPLEIKSNTNPALIIGSKTNNYSIRPGIQFKNNTSQFISGDDGSDEIFGFYAKWGNTRAHDAKLRVYGKASGSWGKYMEFTHTGSYGIIKTDVGDIELSPAGGDVKIDGKITSTASGNNDLKAFAYGNVNDDGTINSGTGNFSVDTGAGTGIYKITFPNESYDIQHFVTILSISSLSLPKFIQNYSTNGTLVVRIIATDGAFSNNDFSFVTYKK